MAYQLRTEIGQTIYRLRKLYCGTRYRHHQRSAGIPSVLSARTESSSWRMVSGMPGIQSETDAYLVAGVGIAFARLLPAI